MSETTQIKALLLSTIFFLSIIIVQGNTEPDEKVNWLIVQDSQGVSIFVEETISSYCAGLENAFWSGNITMTNASNESTWFSDRPYTIAHDYPVTVLSRGSHAVFSENNGTNPNAALVYQNPNTNQTETHVVQLRYTDEGHSPLYDEDTSQLTFEVCGIGIDGESDALPSNTATGPVELFIDNAHLNYTPDLASKYDCKREVWLWAHDGQWVYGEQSYAVEGDHNFLLKSDGDVPTVYNAGVKFEVHDYDLLSNLEFVEFSACWLLWHAEGGPGHIADDDWAKLKWPPRKHHAVVVLDDDDVSDSGNDITLGGKIQNLGFCGDHGHWHPQEYSFDDSTKWFPVTGYSWPHDLNDVSHDWDGPLYPASDSAMLYVGSDISNDANGFGVNYASEIYSWETFNPDDHHTGACQARGEPESTSLNYCQLMHLPIDKMDVDINGCFNCGNLV